MKNLNRTIYVVMGTLLILMIASAFTFRMLGDIKTDKHIDSLAKSVESLPDHSRIPSNNLKTK